MKASSHIQTILKPRRELLPERNYKYVSLSHTDEFSEVKLTLEVVLVMHHIDRIELFQKLQQASKAT